MLLLRFHFWIRSLLLINHIFKCFKKDDNKTFEHNAKELIKALEDDDPNSKYAKYLEYFHEQHLKPEPMKWAIRKAKDLIHGLFCTITIPWKTNLI